MAKSDIKPKRGRPSGYSEEIAAEICGRMAEGESLRKICLDPNMPGRRTVLDWLDDDSHADFRAKYARARELLADFHADATIEIADTPQIGQKTISKATGLEITEADMIEHRRLQVLSRQWYAEKLNPKKYGNKMAIGGADDLPPVETKSTLDLSGLSTAALAEIMALKDASNRS